MPDIYQFSRTGGHSLLYGLAIFASLTASAHIFIFLLLIFAFGMN